MGLIVVSSQEPDPGPEPAGYTAQISAEEISAWVAEAIARNKTVVRSTRSQEALDHVVEVLHQEGETLLAGGILCLISARIAGCESLAFQELFQILLDMSAIGSLDRTCRVCGCTQKHGCPGGCAWVEIDLCSQCDAALKRAAHKSSILPGPGRDG